MRRIARIQQPPSSGVLTKCLHAQSTHSVRSMAATAATSCLSSRQPRNTFSTSPARLGHPLRPSMAKKVETTEGAPTETTTDPELESLDPESFLDPEAQEILADEAGPVIATDLVLPPTERTTAPRADEVPEFEDYTPANSAGQLPVVGGLKGWFSPAQDNWGASKNFTGFANQEKITHPAQLELCARRAVLEALAIQSVGGGVADLLMESWRADGGWERVLALRVTVDGQGRATVEGDVKGVVQGLVVEAGTGARETMVEADQARELMEVASRDWKLVSLKDAKLKFAVAKRIFQLTGHAIPDAKLLNVHNMTGLLATIKKPEPARKLYDAVQQRGELTSLPNVAVYNSRRTPVDVAKSLGRWKVVVGELEKRGLPVLGQDGVDKFREGEWYHGAQPEKKDKKKGRRKA